jgi:hypothetical protein
MTVAQVVDGVTEADSTYMNTLVDAINANTEHAEAQRFYVSDYGAVGDGVTDDSAAIQAAYTAAALISGDYSTYAKAIVSFEQGTRYRVASSLIAKDQVHTEGNGAVLVGPITGADRIDSGTPVPGATDITGQTEGACFTDNEGAGNDLSWPSWSDLTITGFRFGFVSRAFSWAHPQFVRIEFRETDIGYFAYQGCQQWTIVDPNAGYNTHCLIAAGATCFAAGHDYEGDDNYFVDGLRITARRQTMNFTNNDDVNDWFEDAILRPATTSVSAGGSSTFAPTGTFRKVTGRAVYAPQRNNRNQYGWEIGPLNLYDGPRGHVLMRYPIDASFKDLAGEQMFTDVAVNTGEDESILVIGVADTVCSADFFNIDGDNSAGSANYKGAIDIVAEEATTQTQFVGMLITGYVDPRYFTILDQNTQASGSTTSQRVQMRGARITPSIVTEAASGTEDLTTVYIKLAQGSFGGVIDQEDHEVRRQLFADRLPLDGEAQTKAYLSIAGNSGIDTAAQIIKGTCRLYIERLDTGELDFAEYLVNLSPRYAASTTLAVDATAGATTLTVASSGAANAFSPGTAIVIDATEKANVVSVNGAVLTLFQPIVGSFVIGETVTGVAVILSTITALTNAWVNVAIESNMFRITNSLDPVPIRFHALFEYPSPRF